MSLPIFTDFDRYAPRRRSFEEVLDLAVAMKNGMPKPTPDPNDASTIATGDGFRIDRFRLCTDLLEAAYAAVGRPQEPLFHDGDTAHIAVRLGIFADGSDTPFAMVTLFNANNGRQPSLSDVAFPKDGTVDADLLAEALNMIGVPPRNSSHAPADLARDLDLWFENEAWIRREPRFAVSFGFERICFAVAPPVREHVDILVPVENGIPYDGHEHTASYQHYLGVAWERLNDLGYTSRPGFSSWMNKGGTALRKILTRSVEADLGFPDESEVEAISAPAPGR